MVYIEALKQIGKHKKGEKFEIPEDFLTNFSADSYRVIGGASQGDGHNEDEDTPIPKLGLRDIAQMINASKSGTIKVRTLYIDKENKTSSNGEFRRAVIEPVENCKFERIAWLVGTNLASGKRLITAITDSPEMLTNQFEIEFSMNVVGRSKEFVDILDIYILKAKQLSFEEVEGLFPTFSGVKIRKE